MEIRIDGWKSNLTFSSAHFLPDYSQCSHLHGHTYAVHAIVEGDIEKGIVIDFRIIKKIIKEIIKEIDHRVIIPIEGMLDIRKNEQVEVEYNGKKYSFPKEDCVFLPIYSSSAENIASYILKKVVDALNVDAIKKENIKTIRIGVDEGYGQGAWTEWRR